MFGKGDTKEQLTSDGKKVVLGQKYRDTLHGIEGVATARYEFLMACDRICLEFSKDGKVESNTFDIMQIETVAEAPKIKESRSTGGPERSTPPRRGPS